MVWKDFASFTINALFTLRVADNIVTDSVYVIYNLTQQFPWYLSYPSLLSLPRMWEFRGFFGIILIYLERNSSVPKSLQSVMRCYSRKLQFTHLILVTWWSCHEKLGWGPGDRNVPSWKNLAKGLGKRKVLSWKIWLRARVMGFLHQECMKILEDDMSWWAFRTGLLHGFHWFTRVEWTILGALAPERILFQVVGSYSCPLTGGTGCYRKFNNTKIL